MKKQDFIKAVAIKAWMSQDAIAKGLNTMIEVITESLKSWEEVNITGFGAFRNVERKARKWVNPRTGKEITIKAMRSPAFRAGKTFKESVR